MKGSENLKLVLHPQGFYLAVINHFQTKKSKQYSIELFDLTDLRNDLLPQQSIFIKRQVLEFYGVYWEPNNHKIAIHTNAKREVDPSKRDYSLDAKRNGIDIYEMS